LQERILLVDDEPQILTLFSRVLTKKGFSVSTASNGLEALEKLEGDQYAVVITDLKMPRMDGMELLKRVKGEYRDVEVLILTGFGTIESAVEAMKKGAFGYFTKPYNIDEVLIELKRIFDLKKMRRESNYFREALYRRYEQGRLVSKNPKMQEVLKLIKKAAPTNATVLIQGETGTGKELGAYLVHSYSPRRTKPFVPVTCAAIPEGVLESELFGHEKGAFTGAIKQKPGRFEVADGGTLFLDEIGCMNKNVQVKLLRFLQEREIQRVGGVRPITVDVRVVAATNIDLKEEVAKGNFREDLWYRLNVIAIDLPPLRERREDIPELALHFLERYRVEADREKLFITNKALEALQEYHWPGNIRELQNMIERAVVMAQGDTIDVEHLPLRKNGQDTDGPLPEMETSLKKAKHRFESEFIRKALKANKGNITHTAHHIGIPRKNLQQKIKKYEIDAVRYR
jgi:two-component system NtrC family response regulator